VEREIGSLYSNWIKLEY